MWKILIYSVINLINVCVLLGIIINSIIYSKPKVYLYLTTLNFIFCVSYLFIIWIYELKFFINRKDEAKTSAIKKTQLYNFIRNRVFKFAFTTCMTVCMGYWILALGGEKVMTFNFNIYLNVYVHFIIGVQIFLEHLLTERKMISHVYSQDLIVYLIINVLYSIILTSIAKKLNVVVYAFLLLDVNQIIAVFLVLLLISFNNYQLFHFIIRKKVSSLKAKNKEENGLTQTSNSIEESLMTGYI